MVVPGGLKRSVYCELRGGAATISAVACKRGRVLLFAQRVANRRRALLGDPKKMWAGRGAARCRACVGRVHARAKGGLRRVFQATSEIE